MFKRVDRTNATPRITFKQFFYYNADKLTASEGNLQPFVGQVEQQIPELKRLFREKAPFLIKPNRFDRTDLGNSITRNQQGAHTDD